MKFELNQICVLRKHTGEQSYVRIEGRRDHVSLDTMYDVREIENRIGYPALERDLRAAPKGYSRQQIACADCEQVLCECSDNAEAVLILADQAEPTTQVFGPFASVQNATRFAELHGLDGMAAALIHPLHAINLLVS